ncbi:hypothetical protein GCM10023196_036960 [Actinoallomurus vinaceus]|uniref:SAP domain-containing protein n=1 Tax=Actinoallomurus vinaceus TaxID=1080074 RepID=A0ABP8U990_9ACTN
MTVYARSDVSGVSIPPELGGCGEHHRRPVKDGTPLKLFALACPPCERALAGNPQWSAHRWEIPLTPDEEREAEALERQSERLLQQERNEAARERSRQIAALNNGGGQDDEEVVVVGGQAPAPLPESGGDPAPPSSGQDQTSLQLAAEDDAVDLSTLTINQLRVKAREAGVGQGGSKKDLIERIRKASGS